MWNDGVAIKEQVELAPGIYRMELFAPELVAQAKPGQFVNLYCRDKSRLLPRPISICDAIVETGRLVFNLCCRREGNRRAVGHGRGRYHTGYGPFRQWIPIRGRDRGKGDLSSGRGFGNAPHAIFGESPVR